eukprot:CAMPEP_0184372586 /NCGR_PEP_ID=MMETSP1089-20130417/164023_1 /TAXON_ID=38269 ORGANISM="Gloeochaete wittrockiana, Strain SAG46.84" /NCGR_SAMPLE_ID=MMETSP1089 /ASSEMBLY_ACC=CAM_ASM_000445 /LENGTH=32 /DNA_ID= /DNA_START= /DNA_END= /DNA_ORIENTATION=
MEVAGSEGDGLEETQNETEVAGSEGDGLEEKN